MGGSAMSLGFGNTAVCLFVYNRPNHTRQVLEGLARNRIPHLYVFHDALKAGHDPAPHREVASLIAGISFCQVTIETSAANRGVDRSIVAGVNRVLEKNDAVIVLEDDCVPSSTFTDYILFCLNQFEGDPSVFSISGYGMKSLEKAGTSDAYFSPLPSSWGWATWKDRWSKYDPQNQDWKKILKDKKEKARFDLPGNLFSNLLTRQSRGEIEVWDILWYATHFQYGGTAIWPVKSKIKNIGMDGSGVHCVVNDKIDVVLSDDFDAQNFHFPTDRSFTPELKAAFHQVYQHPDLSILERVERLAKNPSLWPEIPLKLFTRLKKKLT